MIIVDTSIWIEYLKGNFIFSALISQLIENREVYFLECIASELLQGIKNKKEKMIILEYWSLLPNFSMDSLWIKAGLYSSEQRLLSKGIGLIDAVIITACFETHSKLWTLDNKIRKNIDRELIFVPA